MAHTLHCVECGKEITFYEKRTRIEGSLYHHYCGLRYQQAKIELARAVSNARRTSNSLWIEGMDEKWYTSYGISLVYYLPFRPPLFWRPFFHGLDFYINTRYIPLMENMTEISNMPLRIQCGYCGVNVWDGIRLSVCHCKDTAWLLFRLAIG